MRFIFALLALLWSALAAAHPMGSISTNRTATLSLRPGALELHYLVDFAELPSATELSRFAQDQAAPGGPASLQDYGARRLDELRAGLSLRINGQATPLTLARTETLQRQGEWGLPTLLVIGVFTAPAPALGAPASLVLEDANFRDAPGWRSLRLSTGGALYAREVRPAGALLVPGEESDPLRYEGEPPQDDTLSCLVVAGAESTAPPRAESAALPARAADPLATLLRGGEGPLWVLFALLGSALLGAGHALTPGHGKTVVAAYLVGARGTAAQAVVLGVVVTLTHVASVFLLGGVALWLSAYVVPEALFPILGVASGAGVVVVGLGMLRARLRRYHGAEAPHAHPGPETGAGLWRVVVLGISGGIVPCPSALVVLLAAISLGRVAFGISLIVAFSLGLAVVLVALGLLVVKARPLLARWEARGASWRWLPVASALVIVLLGTGIAVQAARAAQWLS